MAKSHITVVGNLTADPELRFTPNGKAVANLNIAVNSKHLDRQTNEWVDDQATYWRSSIWNDYAEHVASSLTKGMQVIASGAVTSRTFQTKEGENRTVTELELTDIGPALRFQEAQVRKAAQQGNSGFGGQPQQPSQPAAPADAWGQQAPQQPDPWNTPQAAPAGWGQAAQDSPPF
ncbi:single-stranded DNA-binding protein [Galactobacter sp.]|uniref:single-stranded DNA-binding protein n=1 Tax=Galactobacter sp. TaxID=2676125 RepID=UPI00345D156F